MGTFYLAKSPEPTAPARQRPNDFARPGKIHCGVVFFWKAIVEASCASKHPQPGAVARRGRNDFFRPGKIHWGGLSAAAPATSLARQAKRLDASL